MVLLFIPPATSTFPEGNRVAVWLERAETILAGVVAQVLVVGLYTSDLPLPAISTLSEDTNVAVWLL